MKKLLVYVSLVSLIYSTTFGQLSSDLIAHNHQRSEPIYLNGIPYHSDGAQTHDQHQFFKSLGWAKGLLVYEGILLNDVSLLYNIYNQTVIAYNNKMPTSSTKAILLDLNKVECFEIYDSKFVHHKLVPSIKDKGFLELIYDGNIIDCFVKWDKFKSITTSGAIYPLKAQPYILINNTNYKYNGKKSLYKLFPEKKNELKQFIKKKVPNLTNKNIEGLDKVLEYCEKIL